MSLSIEEINKLKQTPIEGMLPALTHRWSPRSFKDTPVSSHDLKLVLEAAQWAASSSNHQPWRFLVGKKGTETHSKIASTLAAFNQTWATKPDVLILGFAHLKDAKGNSNHYAVYDLGQSVAMLVTQASELGLMTHSMGCFEHNKAREVFGISEDYVLGAVIALGYQDEPAALPNEQLLERELAPRHRKPLSEIALTALDVALEF